jgi:hypothetical protein
MRLVIIVVHESFVDHDSVSPTAFYTRFDSRELRWIALVVVVNRSKVRPSIELLPHINNAAINP